MGMSYLEVVIRFEEASYDDGGGVGGWHLERVLDGMVGVGLGCVSKVDTSSA